MLQHGEFRHFSETRQLVHQWGQEYWFNLRGDLLLQSSVHTNVLEKQLFVFSELFSSECLFLDAPHSLRLVAWVLRQHKRESCLFYILLGRHQQREVSVSASSEVRRRRRRIPTDKSMYIDQFFSCRLSVNIWKDRRQEVRKDSLDAACCPAISSCTLLGIDSGFIP